MMTAADAATPLDVADLEAEQPIAAASTLCADTLNAVFSHLDAHSLARVGATCRMWRDAARSDDLWADLVRRRWALSQRKKGRYKYGERSWREVFRVFNRRLRPPNHLSVSSREIAYATGHASYPRSRSNHHHLFRRSRC